MFAAHEPSPNAVFWSKFTRPTGPPTAPTGAVKGALKKDIPAAESGAEASVDETGAIKNPALKPATKVAMALKPAATGGAPLPSIKEFPKEEPAAPAGDWRNKGEVKSKKVSNKYDLLDNVAAEIDEVDDEKKGREKGAKSGKESSGESVSPESVGDIGKAPRGSTPSTTDSALAACMRRSSPKP